MRQNNIYITAAEQKAEMYRNALVRAGFGSDVAAMRALTHTERRMKNFRFAQEFVARLSDHRVKRRRDGELVLRSKEEVLRSKHEGGDHPGA